MQNEALKTYLNEQVEKIFSESAEIMEQNRKSARAAVSDFTEDGWSFSWVGHMFDISARNIDLAQDATSTWAGMLRNIASDATRRA